MICGRIPSVVPTLDGRFLILDIKIVEGYGDPDSATQLNLNDEDLTVGDLIKFKKEK